MPETEYLSVAPDADDLLAEAPPSPFCSAVGVPPVYPAVSPVEADLTRRIGRGRTFGLPSLNKNMSLSLQLPGNAPIDWSGVLALAGPFGSIDLAQGSRLMRTLTGIDLDSELHADKDRWTWMQAAVVARLAGTPFASTERLSQTPLTDTANVFPMRVVLQSRDHAFVTYGRASASTWIKLLAETASKKERLPQSEYLDLPIDIAVRIAHHELPAGALKTVGIGDMILPLNATFTCNGEGYVHIGCKRLRVRFGSPSILEVTALETKMETGDTMESMENQAIENDVAADVAAQASAHPDKDDETLNSVAVRMDFELGRLNMSLGDLRAVGVGTVMTLVDGSPEAVTIRVSGKTMGHGEIVDIGGKLGIRITGWCKP